MSSVVFSLEQLRALPFDVVVSKIVPMLSQRGASTDEWSKEWEEWTSQNWLTYVRDLPGCRLGESKWWKDRKVCDSPLSAFIVFGAREAMPLTIFSVLLREEMGDSIISYLLSMHYRRQQQGSIPVDEPGVLPEGHKHDLSTSRYVLIDDEDEEDEEGDVDEEDEQVQHIVVRR